MKFFRLSLFNYFHYYLFSLVIGLLCLESYFFILLYVFFFYKIRKYPHKKIVVFTTLIILSLVLLHDNVKKKEPVEETFKIINISEKEYNNEYILKQGFSKYLLYSNQDFKIGDIVKLNYKVKQLKPARMPGSFNSKYYYGAKHIYYELISNDIEVIDNKFCLNKIRNDIKLLFSNYPLVTKAYLNMFLFGEDTFDESFKESKKSLGISHLFALSGLHVNLIVGFILMIYKLFNKRANKVFILAFLVFYLFLAGSSFSLLRAVLMYSIISIFERFGLTRLDALSLSFVLILLYSPYARYHYGFILSFLVTFFIITAPKLGKLKSLLYYQVISYFSSLIIVSNLNNGIYLYSFFTSLIYTTLFPILIMPLILISIIPKGYYISEPLLNFINKTTINLTLPFIKMPQQHLIVIVIYILLVIKILNSYNFKEAFKKSFIIIIFIVGMYFSNYLNPNLKVLFLDVGQGDSTFIQNPYNKGNILIDAHTGTFQYLKTLGNIEIDYFFITHGDFDHASEAVEIVNNIKVNNIILNKYDTTKIATELKQYNAKSLDVGDKINCGMVSIEVFGPLKDYKDNNNNSLVFKVWANNQTILFTGDIEKEAELDLINYYNYQLKSDIIHIAHHGSNTGTTNSFLNLVNPTQAIISVSDNNIYNHPSIEVIDRLDLKNVLIYLTSNSQTIIKKKCYWPKFIKNK